MSVTEKYILVVFIGLLGPLNNLSFADVAPYEIKSFTSVCTEESSTGFKWKNSRWVLTNFNTTKYIIKKISYSEIANNDLMCNPNEMKLFESGPYSFIKACYNFRRRNEEYSRASSMLCSEKYENKKLEQIYCDGLFEAIKFQPNGNFIFSQTNSSIESNPPKDYKDSIGLSVGFCSTSD